LKEKILKYFGLTILILFTVTLITAALPGEFNEGPKNLGEYVLWNNINGIYNQMVATSLPDTALPVYVIRDTEAYSQEQVMFGTGVTLAGAATRETAVYLTEDWHRSNLLMSWSNDFADSVGIHIRLHKDMDPNTSYPLDLDPSTYLTVDSTLVWLKDNTNMVGGTVAIPLVDRFGQSINNRYISFAFEKVGAGTVTVFKSSLFYRREW
jgi:hypothetical protein